MGKRSNFPRVAQDAYQTEERGVLPLIPYLNATGVRTFVEPCVGQGFLQQWLVNRGFECVYANDINRGVDALIDPYLDRFRFDAIITNPPWRRDVLHPMIDRFMRIAPTWLLFDADWPHNLEAAPLLKHCSTIVPVGRLIWMPGTKQSGKDNVAWYRFHIQHVDGPKFKERVKLPPRGKDLRLVEEAA